MYAIYETEAFILESSGRREADRIFSLYTEEFGMIRASAIAVRKMQSKLRSHLTDFSLVSVSLVRGKETWRITSARRVIDAPRHLIQPLLLIKRLVHGEMAQPKLFSLLRDSYEKKMPETFTVINILKELGYVDRNVSHDHTTKKDAVAIINKAIHESQL